MKRRGSQVAQALREATTRLAETSETARLDAELLMAHALGVSRSEMLLRHMDAAAPDAFTALVERRAAHEPVAYILGSQEFYGLDFAVSPAVLIPRRDSETLVEQALVAKPDARRVLDCGTGSGALLLAVLHNLSNATGIGIDASEAALEIARRNAANLGLARRAEMIRADWTEPGWIAALQPPFDLILANPPYVEADAELARSVRAYEPGAALFSGPEGLDDYRALIPQLPQILSESGQVMVEIGWTQAEAVTAIAEGAGFVAHLHRDLENRPRVLQLLCKK
ncbi:MAG: peptide chain release factor N(5)-glutamine methyltransferase [Sphingomonadaceae bacterium]